MQQEKGGDSDTVDALSNLNLGQDFVSNTDCWVQDAAQGGPSGIGGALPKTHSTHGNS